MNMYNSFLKSNYSKFVISLGLLSMMISAYKYCSLFIVVVQAFLFFSFALNINCGIYGGCMSAPVLPLIITIILTLILVFDLLGIFDLYKNKLKHIYYVFEKSNETYLKYIINPNDEEISDRYKNRDIAKILNKNYKYTPNNFNSN